MKKTRHQNRNQRKRSAIKLLVESLEPRLVLSAIGFGGEREHFEFGERNSRDRSEFRLELSESGHRDGNGSRSENRGEFKHAIGQRYDHFDHDREHDDDDHFDRRPGRHHDYADIEFNWHDDHDDRHDDDHDEPFAGFPSGEGEFGDFDDERDNDFGFGTLDGSFALPLFVTPASAESTVVIVSLQPTLNPTPQGTLGQLVPPASSFDPSQTPSTGQASGLDPTLPIPAFANLDTSNRAPSLNVNVDTPIDSFESPSSNGNQVSENAPIQVEATSSTSAPIFVSFTTAVIDRLAGIDGSIESEYDLAFESSVFALPSTATEAVTSANNSHIAVETLTFRDDSIWAAFSDGGFVDIDASDIESTAETIQVDSNGDNLTDRDPSNDSHDAFWFEFDDAHLDLLIDSLHVDELATDQHENESQDDLADAAWLEDEGGMIVISMKSPHNADGGAAEDEAVTPTDISHVASADYIPMRAEVGVFQVIEVASSLNDQVETESQSDETIDEASGKVATDSEDVAAPINQAAAESGPTPSEPIRAAALPWVAAVAALWESRRKKRMREEEILHQL